MVGKYDLENVWISCGKPELPLDEKFVPASHLDQWKCCNCLKQLNKKKE